jgi:hypothetical protein
MSRSDEREELNKALWSGTYESPVSIELVTGGDGVAALVRCKHRVRLVVSGGDIVAAMVEVAGG